MKTGHKHGRSGSVKTGAKRASASKKASSKTGSYKSRKTPSRVGSYKTRKASPNGSGYRSAKTGRYVTSNAPRITSLKERSATVGRATKRLKTTVTVDLPKARRSK